MEETLIGFQVAKLAKEKKFPQNLFNTSWYNELGNKNGRTDLNKKGEEFSEVYPNEPSFYGTAIKKEHKNEFKLESFIAPTQSLLQKWIREVHNIHICIDTRWNNFEKQEIIHEPWIKDMRKVGPSKKIYTLPSIVSYEEALEEALLQALNLIE